MQRKTIEELHQKAWYRLLKVIYGLSFAFLAIKILDFVTKEFLNDGYIIFGFALYVSCLFFIYIGFEIVRRLFFYVILGTMRPTDDTYFIKLKKQKKVIIISSIVIIIALAIGIWDANRIDDEKYRARNSSVITPNYDLPALPPLPELPELPKLPKIKLPEN